MTLFTTTTCYGCKRSIPPDGGFYCDACATRQLADYLEEMRAYEDFHAFADQIARGDR